MKRREVYTCVPNDADNKLLFSVVDIETGEEAFVVSRWLRRPKPAEPRVPGLVPARRARAG